MVNHNLRAEFLTDDKLGLYRGARCKLPTGEVVEVVNRRTPFYDLARVLAEMGYGGWHLRAYTPEGTPSLSGQIGKLAGLMVEESDKGGLRLRKYRPFPPGRSVIQRDPGSEGTQVPGGEELTVSEPTRPEEAA
jgi:hypothetical protein